MKKVLGKMSAFIFAGFCVAVLALLMSLTYGALQKLFPGNFANQMWGLVMFDIAAMCWAVAFVFQSKSTIQYAATGLGFVVAFIGTLGMVAAEVMLSGQNLAEVDTSQIGQWMVYGFIIVTAIHAALVYAHHAGAPDISEQINVGVARGEIVTEAINQATHVLDAEKQQLAVTIRNDIISKTKRDLGLIEADPRMPFIPAQPRQYEQTVPYPVTQTNQEDAQAKARPLSQRFRDWVNSLQKTPATPSPASIENTNETWQRNGSIMGWRETPAGRVRLWCLPCQEEGASWLSPTPCEHILNAKPEEQIPTAEAIKTREALIEEYAVKLEEGLPHYHPVPLEPATSKTKPAPSSTRPLYNEDTYHGDPGEPKYDI
jgi:hypothetical protein